MKQNILYLIDDYNYITSNCFQHQLYSKIKDSVEIISIKEFLQKKKSFFANYQHIISVLKLRTLAKNLNSISEIVGFSIPFVVYDQDPWESYRKNSVYLNSYERISEFLNVKFFAVTTEWWVNYIRKKGHSARFVNMWVLPEYCEEKIKFEDRKIKLGFAGSIHNYRKEFFEKLKQQNVNVKIQQSNKSYLDYLNYLNNLKIQIHTTDSEFVLADNTKCNLSYGLWVKDIEATARGCFSIRNYSLGYESIQNIPTIKTFKNINDIPAIISDIENMSIDARYETISSALKIIRDQDRWQETANILLCRV